jgi:hypothetical protein
MFLTSDNVRNSFKVYDNHIFLYTGTVGSIVDSQMASPLKLAPIDEPMLVLELERYYLDALELANHTVPKNTSYFRLVVDKIVKLDVAGAREIDDELPVILREREGGDGIR